MFTFDENILDNNRKMYASQISEKNSFFPRECYKTRPNCYTASKANFLFNLIFLMKILKAFQDWEYILRYKQISRLWRTCIRFADMQAHEIPEISDICSNHTSLAHTFPWSLTALKIRRDEWREINSGHSRATCIIKVNFLFPIRWSFTIRSQPSGLISHLYFHVSEARTDQKAVSCRAI